MVRGGMHDGVSSEFGDTGRAPRQTPPLPSFAGTARLPNRLRQFATSGGLIRRSAALFV
jgi:hypothetical protein